MESVSRYARIIFVLAFSLRLMAAFLVPQERAVFPDSQEYLTVSENILSGRGIQLHDGARAKRPPTYPIFLAPHVALFGRDALPIQISQACLGALSCVLLFLLTRPIIGERPAKVAAAVLAVSPLHVAASASLLIEPLLMFLLLLELLLLQKAVAQQRHRWSAAAGLVAGVATLLQAGHALFFLFVLLFVWRGARPKRIGPLLATFALVSLALPTVWAVRNAMVLERFVPLTSNSGYTLYESLGPWANGGTVGDRMFLPPKEDRGEVEYDAYLRDRALDTLRRNPGRAVGLAFEKQRRFWSVIPNHPGFRTALGYATTLSFAPILLFFLYGLFRSRRIGWDGALLWAPILYFALLHMVFLGSIRYRLPIEPFVIAVASWAAVGLWLRRKKPKQS